MQNSSPDSALAYHTRNFNVKLKHFAHTATATDANANAGGSAIALSVHYRAAKKGSAPGRKNLLLKS